MCKDFTVKLSNLLRDMVIMSQDEEFENERKKAKARA